MSGFVLPKQAAILCGGLGTRLGALTKDTPKTLLPVGGRPYLELLVQEVMRSGVRDIILLAAHFSEQIETFARDTIARFGPGLSIRISIEPELAGTGGALFHARDLLHDHFFLLNGDSFFDLPLHAMSAQASDPSTAAVLALRWIDNADRYGVVKVDGERVTDFGEKLAVEGGAWINGGVYLFRKPVFDLLRPVCSLEHDVLPRLCVDYDVRACFSDGFFIDIGLRETYDQAQRDLTAHRQKPAVFLDRDGVINRDHGHVGTVERFEWVDGAADAICHFNDAGYYVFVVTNQAGIGKGKYGEGDYWLLRDHIRNELANFGGRIDDERFCPDHPDASDARYRLISSWRKPAPGMIVDLMEKWPVSRKGSLLIGDNETDLAAAAAAGIPGHLFSGGNLFDFVKGLNLQPMPHAR